MKPLLLSCALLLLANAPAFSAPRSELYDYVDSATLRIEEQLARNLEDFKSAEGRARRHAEALEMFGLSPMPERTDLKPVVTGRIENEHVVVEKIHFQSSPGLYVTANLYLPKKIEGPLPTILYVCGHAVVKTNNISYGNKAGYQHHGAWFARHGYACMLIDTIQLGEIGGLHHGTNREGMWWWNSRGYSPAAVEAWNSMRALDYLETRPEVDKTRFGMTGRSGGGAYTWSVIALDPRIKVAAPVAGITDLRNHVIDNVVEGHCDCMYFVNTYAWDYPMLAGLAAPRPLLIVNTDADRIFPLDGVVRTHNFASKLYEYFKKPADLGLVIGPGPHKDTQDLQVPVFRWFNQHLRNTNVIVDVPATNHFTAAELRVFSELPADERVTTVHDWFIRKAPAGPAITSREEWARQRDEWMRGLREKVFRNWPEKTKLATNFLAPTVDGVVHVNDPRPNRDLINQSTFGEKAMIHLRRRYMLVGTTLDSIRVNDIASASHFLHENTKGRFPIYEAEGDLAVNVLFASLFTDKIKTLRLKNLPATLDKSGPDYLNVLRVLDIREALALAAERTNIELTDSNADITYARQIAERLDWQTTIR